MAAGPRLGAATASRRSFLAALACTVAGTGLAGCTKTSSTQRISFLNWQDYVDPQILKDFTAKSGLAVGYETYESNDQLQERLIAADVTRKGGRKTTSFDLIVPSTNLFTRLRDGNALQPLDTAIVTTQLLDNLNPVFRELTADPQNVHSVPWGTGTTGIGYDTTVFTTPPDWSVFLDATHKGRMSVLDEVREAFAAALFSLGEDPNSSDPTVIAKAEKQLGAMLANATFDSTTYLDDLADGKLVAAQGFSTDVLQAARRNPKLGYVIPASGATVWVDLLCIPVNAPNAAGANEFIAYYLDPQVSARNAEYNLVATGNLAARNLLPPELVSNPAIYPPKEVEASLKALRNLGDTEKDYEQAWERLTGG